MTVFCAAWHAGRHGRADVLEHSQPASRRPLTYYLPPAVLAHLLVVVVVV